MNTPSIPLGGHEERRPRSYIASEPLPELVRACLAACTATKYRQYRNRSEHLMFSSNGLPQSGAALRWDEEATGSEPVTPTKLPAGFLSGHTVSGSFGRRRTAIKRDHNCDHEVPEHARDTDGEGHGRGAELPSSHREIRSPPATSMRRANSCCVRPIRTRASRRGPVGRHRIPLARTTP